MKDKRPVEITSSANKRYRELLSLHGSRGIRRLERAIVPGRRFVDSYVENAPQQCRAFVCRSGETNPYHVPGVEQIVLSSSLFRTLDKWGCGSPLLEIGVPLFQEWRRDTWPAGCTLVLPLQDPKNMGAALRCAAAFGIRSIIVTRESVHPYHPDAIRASAAVLPLLTVYTISESFLSYSWPEPFIALHTRGTPINAFHWPEAFGLVVGTEGPGIPKDTITPERISIPMEQGVESLNATSAVSIALFQWRLHNPDVR